MRASTHGKTQRLKALLMSLLCVAAVAAPTLGAADYAAAATTGTSLPEIISFSAQPLVLPDGGFAVYAFEVKNATGIKLLEAGEVINEFNGPPTGLYKGKANGRTTYQIRTRGMNSFDAILLAGNPVGSQQRTLKLSFASKTATAGGSQIPPADNTSSAAKKPEWLGQTFLVSGTGPATGQIVSTYPPPFEKCTKDCDNCLRPADAAARGYTEQCSKGPCYYSPDKQQYWYCYKKPLTVWCCADGKVSEVTKDVCAKKGGTAYSTQAAALKACDAQGWCCKDGKVGPALRSRCQEAAGRWYLTEKEAVDACAAPPVWCCKDGNVIQTSKESCDRLGGAGYASEAEALKDCQPSGWCCKDGKMGPATRARCLEAGGRWYLTEKEAIDACQSNIWCCRDGKVMETSKELCAQMGGSGYASESEALRSCQALIWCCIDGKVVQTTRETCYNRGGTAYATEADALRACQQATPCWCCAGGKVFTSTVGQCSQYGGNCYSSQTEATRYCQQATSCWCCAGGKVFTATQGQCAQYGGNCYTSQSEATRYCQPPPPTTCYCCVDGKVSQMTTAACTRYGGTCFSTLDAANKSCLRYIPPPLTRPPTIYQPPVLK